MMRKRPLLRLTLAVATAVALVAGVATAGPKTLCHVPPGNSGNAHTIVVGHSAVAAHLRHGDSIGACPEQCEGVRSRVPATGQTRCWDTHGVEIDCAGTGQDGELQLGASALIRFTDNLDGTVTDNLTGLIWLQNAGCFFPRDPSTAIEVVRGLASGNCGLSDGSLPGDWRLPNIKELESLVDYGQEHLGPSPGHPFIRVRDNYLSTTADEADPQFAHWSIILFYYEVIDSFWNRAKSNMWPVRGGPAGCDSVPSPVPKTGQTDCWDSSGNLVSCAGTGWDGEYQAGVSASPRFTDNRDGSVTDDLTGLIWLQDPNCLGGLAWQQALDAAGTLASGTCGLTDDSMNGDWRLPNIKELLSLLDYGQAQTPYPPDHPFSGPLWGYYWSSSTPFADTDQAWVAPIQNGKVTAPAKTTNARVWPVRSDWAAFRIESRSAVTVDIQPGYFPNSVNPHSGGVIPVAILGSNNFHVANVEVTTLAFGSDGAPIAHLNGHLQDVNYDGIMDLMTHYRTQETGIACGDETATLSGETLDGQPFKGTDSIRTVGCRETRRPAIWMKDEDRPDTERRGEPVDVWRE